jgi:uncharacterized membrane protein YhaH (DUF805 family)
VQHCLAGVTAGQRGGARRDINRRRILYSGDAILGRAISSGFSNYTNFNGRASRSAFWYWAAFVIIVSIPTQMIDLFIGFPVTRNLANLGLLLPSIAVAVRRLHDIDRTGWWQLLSFTIIGIPVLLWWSCAKGTDGPNRYGPDPLAS